MEVLVAVDPGRYAVKAAASVAPRVGNGPGSPPVTTWTPTLAWLGPGGEVAVGHAASEAAVQAPEGLVEGWLDRIFSLRPLGGEDTSGPRAADVLVALVDDVLRRTAQELGQEPDDVRQVRLALVEEHGWSPPQLAAVQRALERAGRAVFPEAELEVVPLSAAEALLGLPEVPEGAPVLVLDVGATATTALLLDPDGPELVRRAPGMGGERLERIRRESSGVVEDDRTEPHTSDAELAQLLGGEVRAMVATALPILDEAAQRGARVERVLVVGGAASLGLVARVAERDLGLPVQKVDDPAHAAARGALRLLGLDEWWGTSAAAPAGAVAAQRSRWPLAVAAAALLVVGGSLAVLAWPDPQVPEGALPAVSSASPSTAAVSEPPSPSSAGDDAASTTRPPTTESAEESEEDSEPIPDVDADEVAPQEPAVPMPTAEPTVPVVPLPPVEPDPPPSPSEPASPTPQPPETSDPVPTEPLPTEPLPTEPLPTEPPPTEPLPTEPLPTEPPPTEPLPTEPLPTGPPLPTVPEPPLPPVPVPTPPAAPTPTGAP